MEGEGIQTTWEPAEPSRGQEAAPPWLLGRPGPRLSHGVPLVTGLPKASAQGRACEPWEVVCSLLCRGWGLAGLLSVHPQHHQVCAGHLSRPGRSFPEPASQLSQHQL